MTGIVAVVQMAAGDGTADIVGRRWGSKKWPWSQSKSYVGSAAFVLAGFAVSMGVLLWFAHFGALDLGAMSLKTLALRVFLISVACAAVELVPVADDNLTVPIVGAFLAKWLLN